MTNEVGGPCGIMGKGRVLTRFWWGNLGERDHLGYLDKDGRVILKLILQPLLRGKSNKYYIFWVCVCSLKYPACNAHAPYCHLWPAPLYSIFTAYLINGAIFEKKKVIEQKYLSWFFYSVCLKYFSFYEELSEIWLNTSSGTIILPVVLYGCETWSLTLREERKLRVFENIVLRRIFGPRRDEVTGEWRRLHNE